MARELPSKALASTLDEALEMLRAYSRDLPAGTPAEPLPSLLAQCESAVAAIEGPQPLRSIHHFACTGGTLMSKALFALPNTVVLSEIDPLSKLTLTTSGRVPFAPTDLIHALRHSVRAVEDATLIATFLEGLSAAKAGLEKSGRHLVLRDHAHSQFCQAGVDFDARPTLHEMLAGRFDLRSILTVRHPLDSYLALTSNKWVHFTPPTLEEYARRYLAFLDRHAGVTVVSYEEFTTAPEAVLRRMCAVLELNFSPLATALIGAVRMTGDSGRRSERIGARPRRPVPAEIEAQRGESRAYQDLCMRFGYAP
jgi:hypothetical protein